MGQVERRAAEKLGLPFGRWQELAPGLVRHIAYEVEQTVTAALLRLDQLMKVHEKWTKSERSSVVGETDARRNWRPHRLHDVRRELREIGLFAAIWYWVRLLQRRYGLWIGRRQAFVGEPDAGDRRGSTGPSRVVANRVAVPDLTVETERDMPADDAHGAAPNGMVLISLDGCRRTVNPQVAGSSLAPRSCAIGGCAPLPPLVRLSCRSRAHGHSRSNPRLEVLTGPPWTSGGGGRSIAA